MRKFISSILIVLVTIALVSSCGKADEGAKKSAASTSKAGGSSKSKLTEPGEDTFTAADAAAILGVDAAQLKPTVAKGTDGGWGYAFTAADGSWVSFNAKAFDDKTELTDEMDQYRSNLELAAMLDQWKDVPGGAYSDISGLGDEAIWSNVSDSLVVRQGNVKVQVLQPSDKKQQIKIVQAFLKKL